MSQAAPDSAEPSTPASAVQEEDGPLVVGMGASAGGLAALEAFFDALGEDAGTGLAFVVVQHLARDQQSALAEILQHHTWMSVAEIVDGVRVEAGHVYVIPPGRDVAILNGALTLLETTPARGVRLPIDYFLHSLAQDHAERAVAVILSGTGTDGTLGIRAIKARAGLVMVQDPDAAEYRGMPESAIHTGLADHILRPEDMPAALIAYARHARRGGSSGQPRIDPTASDILRKVCVLLRAQTGHDFSQYKTNTLARRVERRMALQQIEQPEQYIRYLQDAPTEAVALFQDLLIGVTRFFRDPKMFAAVESEVIPRMFAGKGPGTAVRIWVIGCSTGEEAYSLAILVREHLETTGARVDAHIFATDIDGRAIERARRGVFPASIANDITPARLAQFFTQDPSDGTYRANKSIRDLLIFSQHNVIQDPPLSKMDLIACRNLLIYMNADLQKQLIPLFHYALSPGGMLFLGSSETVGEFGDLFSATGFEPHIHLRRSDAVGMRRLPLGNIRATMPWTRTPMVPAHTPRPAPAQGSEGYRGVIERALLQHYAPTAVLINSRGDILHIYGHTGSFLEPAPGDATMNILLMAREGLRSRMSAAVHRAAMQSEAVHYPEVAVKANGQTVLVDLSVEPVMQDGASAPPLLLVLLEEVATAQAPSTEPVGDTMALAGGADEARLVALERDLRAKEECLQTTLEQLEGSNQELRSTNEEMQSINEEMQSANEELETSKEELQSVNEELSTVNAELQTKVADLSRANNDMNNLLAGTGVATLFVDLQLRIARFTPAAADVMNLISTDVGRPVGQLASNLAAYDRLVEDTQSVLDTLRPVEKEVKTKQGGWVAMRIQPYRTLENVIDGAVLTFMDITDRKRVESELQAAHDLAIGIVDTVREPMLVLTGTMRVMIANSAFYRTFHLLPQEAERATLYELDGGRWDIPRLRTLLEEIIPEQSTLEGYSVSYESGRVGRRELILNARRLCRPDTDEALILLAMEDVTGSGS